MKQAVFSVVRSWFFAAAAAGIFLMPVAAMSADRDTRRAAMLPRDRQVVQVLSRLTFGPRDGDVERVAKIGVQAFIDEQLDPSSIPDDEVQKRIDKLYTLKLPSYALNEQYDPPKVKPSPTPTPSPGATSEMTPTPTPSPDPAAKPTPTPKNAGMVLSELRQSRIIRAVYSDRQLYEMMVDVWENHFSIYGNKEKDRILMTSYDRDTIRPFAMGRFRDLLGAVAHSPAMLYYLDNWQSSVVREYKATKDKPARKTGGINENYARELMELHTLGVDGGYTQKDVQEVARCFTGWTIRKPNEDALFIFNPQLHDNGEKVVLGQKIPANGGIADGERVLDILAKSPSTAKFIATKLARRFFDDDPPRSVIDRAAAAFSSSDGSITATLRSIFKSPEFMTTPAHMSKVKSPFEFAMSALRITGAETDGGRGVQDWLARLGQPLFGRITPDGYPEKSSEWLSNNALINRFNFASALATNSIKGTSIELKKIVPDNLTPQQAGDEIEKLILQDKISVGTRKVLDDIVAQASGNLGPPPPETTDPKAPKIPDPQTVLATKLTALAIGSPEFQRK